MPLISELLTKITADNSQFKQAMSESEQRIDIFGKKSVQAADAAGKSFTRFIGVLGGSAAALGLLKSINTATIAFSESLADLSAITGATGKDLKFLEEASKEFGTTTAYNASQVAEAFKLVGGAKADLLGNLPALKSVTAEVITLSTAAGIDLDTAAKTVGSALNQFGAGADQANRFVNVLAAGSKFGAAEVDDLAMSLKYAGPVAASLGLSIEDTVSAIELLAQAGIKGEQAGTGLRAVLLKLGASTDNSINPAVVGLTTALENLRKKNLDVTEAGKMFGTNAVTAGLALTSFADKSDAMTKSITGTQVAYEQAGIKAESYAFKVKQLSNAYYGLKVAAGEASVNLLYGIKSGGEYIAQDIQALFQQFDKLGIKAQQTLGFESYEQRKLNEQGNLKTRPLLGRLAVSQGALSQQLKESSIPSIAGGNFVKSEFAKSLDAAGISATKFANAVDKSAENVIESALKSSAGTGDLLGRIISGANANRVKADTTDFESLASELINFSQNNSASMENKRYQANTLNRLEAMANFAQQQGEDATAMREVLKSLQEFVTKQQAANDIQKLEVTVTPTKYAHIEWSLSDDNKVIVNNLMDERLSREARGVAR